MQDLIPLDWANFGFLNDNDGDSLANRTEDFQRVARLLPRSAFVYFNDGGEIAPIEDRAVGNPLSKEFV